MVQQTLHVARANVWRMQSRARSLSQTALGVFVAGVAMAATSGCYFDRIDSVEDLATVTTVVDSQVPFLRDARTYAMPDTVIHAKRAQGADIIGHESDDEILAKIRA